DAPRLPRHKRAQALDLLDLGSILRVNAQLLRRVLKGQRLEIIGVDWPAHLVAQVSYELVEPADAGEKGSVVRRHQFSLRSGPSTSPGSALRPLLHPHA